MALKNGEFGKLDDNELDVYRQKCNKIWPHANVFQDQDTLSKLINEVLSNNDGNDLAKQFESVKINENEN